MTGVQTCALPILEAVDEISHPVAGHFQGFLHFSPLLLPHPVSVVCDTELRRCKKNQSIRNRIVGDGLQINDCPDDIIREAIEISKELDNITVVYNSAKH